MSLPREFLQLTAIRPIAGKLSDEDNAVRLCWFEAFQDSDVVEAKEMEQQASDWKSRRSPASGQSPVVRSLARSSTSTDGVGVS
jgi:hypothetical protein